MFAPSEVRSSEVHNNLLMCSIMMSRTICFTSIVLDSRYDKLPGIEYYEIAVNGEPVRFAQHGDSVLPAMLQDLVSTHNVTQSVGGELPGQCVGVFSCLVGELVGVFSCLVGELVGVLIGGRCICRQVYR